MVSREQGTGRATDCKSTHGFGDSQMKRLFPILAAGIMASLSITAGIGAVHAQEKAEARYYGAVTPRHISMGVGKSEIIDLPQDAAEIFVADPAVANAVVR